MALDDVEHVEAVAIIKQLVECPSLHNRDIALAWLNDHHPPPSAYTAAMRSLGES